MNTAAARSTTASCSSSVASARRNIDRHGRPRAATMFGGNSSSSSCTRVDIVGALKGSGQQRPGRGHRSSRLAVAADVSRGGLVVDRLEFTPVNSGTVVLKEVNLRIPPTGLNLIVGRSGFGKSTLLHLITGLSEPTGGVITFTDQPEYGHMSAAARLERVGLVFQFPERHFLGKDMLGELTFGWPQKPEAFPKRRALALKLQDALYSVGMSNFPLDTPVTSLSGGYKRRLALAIQLVRDPYVLCLDEPLAGLDWKARAEVVSLLADLRKERAVVVVSHDVEEISPVTDRAFRMGKGGVLTDAPELARAGGNPFGSAANEFSSF